MYMHFHFDYILTVEPLCTQCFRSWLYTHLQLIGCQYTDQYSKGPGSINAVINMLSADIYMTIKSLGKAFLLLKPLLHKIGLEMGLYQ